MEGTEGDTPPVRQASAYVTTDFPWAMFHHDPAHTGSTQAIAPSGPGFLWNVATGGGVSSSPVVSEGTVYAGSLDNNLYALNESSGGVLWTWGTNGAVVASPAAYNGVVYVASQDQTLYALSTRTGQLLWSSVQIATLSASPVVADGLVFLGTQYSSAAGTAKVLAIDAASGSVAWSYNWAASISSSPAVDQGRVFVGTSNGWVLALNETSGLLLWQYQTANSQVSSPAVLGGYVYASTASNRIFALNVTTGAVKWSQNLGGSSNPTPSSPAVGEGRVVFGTGRGQVVAVDATSGATLWTRTTGGSVSSSPALTRDSVLVGSSDGGLYSLKLTDGTVKWMFTTGGPVLSSPALADGIVFFGSQDGRIYAVGPAPPVLQVSVTVAPLVIRAEQMSTISVLVVANSVPQSVVSLSLVSNPPGNVSSLTYQGSGVYTAVYTAPVVGSQTLVLFDVSASKPGYVVGSGRGGVFVEPPSPLTVSLTASPVSVAPGGNATLMLQLLNGSLPVTGAVVTVQSSLGGQFSNVLDLGNGNYTVRYSPPNRDFKEPTPLTVIVAATKPGFMPVSSAAQLVVFGSRADPRTLPEVPVVPIVAGGVLVSMTAVGAYLLKGREKGEKPRTLERGLEFREAMLRAVDSAFELVGPNVWKAIMRSVERRYGVTREEIPDKLEAFDLGLIETLGQGATLVERLILKRLSAELNVEALPSTGDDFVTAVRNVEAYFLNPKKAKRARH